MSHPLPRRTRSLAVLAALPLAVVLTGCGASLEAQTYQERQLGDASNVSLETLAIRNLSVAPPSSGSVHEAGADARVILRVVNNGAEDDRLLSASTPAAGEVVVLEEGRPTEVEIPAGQSTDERASLILRDLTDDLRAGEYVLLTLRFENAGTVEARVPVAVTGRAGRPVFTREEGSEEGEPALQAPTGGHSEDEGGEGSETEGEGGEASNEGETEGESGG